MGTRIGRVYHGGLVPEHIGRRLSSKDLKNLGQ
jgi:hypothetical protein